MAAGDMECVKFNKERRCTYFAKTPVPKITGEEDAIVRVKFAGICHTDFDVIQVHTFEIRKHLKMFTVIYLYSLILITYSYFSPPG